AGAPRCCPGVAAVSDASAEISAPESKDTLAASYSEVAVRLAILIRPYRHRMRRKSHGTEQSDHGHEPDYLHGPNPQVNPHLQLPRLEVLGAKGGEIGTCAIGLDENL